MTDQTYDTRLMLEALHQGGKWGYYWVINGKKKKTIWFYAGSPPPVPDGEAVYFGVHTMRQVPETNARGEKAEPENVRGQIAYLDTVNCLFAEFDSKDFEGGKPDALAHIMLHAGLAPSIVVDSGGGYHAYWLLDQPYQVDGPQALEHITQLQRRWVDWMGADAGAKDLARVLRVPGSINHKYDPPAPVQFIDRWFKLDCRYSLTDLEAQIPKPVSLDLDLSTGLNLRKDVFGPWDDPWTGQGDPGQVFLEKALQRAAVGNRDDTGIWLACQLRDLDLKESEILGACQDYAARVPQSPHDQITEKDAKRWVKSALSRPRRDPPRSTTGLYFDEIASRPVKLGSNGHGPELADLFPPETLPAPAGEVEVSGTATTEAESTPPPDLDGARRTNQDGRQVKPGKTTKPRPPTDDELARAWIEVDEEKTAYGLGNFRRYARGFWQPIDMDLIKREILTVCEFAKQVGIKPTANRVASVTELARLLVQVPMEKWDADPDIIVCKNGTLHIPTRDLREHDPEYYQTSALEFDYDPAVDCPHFKYVLDGIADGAQDFLQEFAGYAMTTSTRYEVALWLCGPPGGGKSTLLGGFETLLGPRVMQLGLMDIERSRFALTNLPGKTLAISTEQPSSFLGASYLLNAIISGETVTVDRKFLPPVEIRPTVKLAWAMNDLPRVQNPEDGLFRRVKVLQVPAIPEDMQNPAIKEAVLTEGAGILNWALAGLDRLRERGRFVIPPVMQEATNYFKTKNDIPALFLDEEGERGADFETKSSVLYDRYKTWCQASGHKPASATSIADDWRRLGLESKKKMDGMYWVGVQLRTNPTMNLEGLEF